MNGFAHMRPGDAGQAMHGLAQRGQQLSEAWRGAKSAIAGNEGGIGNDVLGTAFRAVYQKETTAVFQAADQVPGAIVNDADLGMKGVHGYEGTEATNTSLFNNEPTAR